MSTKEFLWDSSFNANLIFFRVSGHFNLTKIAKIRSEKAGLRGGVLDAQGEDQGAEIYPRLKVVKQTSDRLICYMIQR